MPDPALDVDDDLPRIELVPAPVQILGDCTKLDNKVSREVLWLGLATLLPPQPHQGSLIVAHDDPSVGAANEGAAVLAVLFHMVVFMLSPPNGIVCGRVMY